MGQGLRLEIIGFDADVLECRALAFKGRFVATGTRLHGPGLFYLVKIEPPAFRYFLPATPFAARVLLGG